MAYKPTPKVYAAIIEARKDAEAGQDSVREAVRRGLEMKRRDDAKKSGTPGEIRRHSCAGSSGYRMR